MSFWCRSSLSALGCAQISVAFHSQSCRSPLACWPPQSGFAPALKHNEDALDIIVQAIEKAGYKPGAQIAIAIDPASSGFFEEGVYNLRTEGRRVTAVEMIDMYAKWIAAYPIVSLEDGLAEDDRAGWRLLNERLGSRVQLVGDDIFVTNVEYIARGIAENVANAVLIKLNQIGTLTETIDAIQLATDAGWRSMVRIAAARPWTASLPTSRSP